MKKIIKYCVILSKSKCIGCYGRIYSSITSPDIFCIDCKKRQIVYENELEDFDYYFDKRGKWKQIFLNFSELDKLRELRDGEPFWVEELDLLEVSESALMKKYSAISKLKKKLKNFNLLITQQLPM